MQHPIKHLLFVFQLVTIGMVCNGQTFTLNNTTVNVDTVTTQVNIPWELVWGPDDHIWMTDGPKIKRLNPVNGDLSTVLSKPGTNGLGMVLHPDFPVVPEVYAVFDNATYYWNGNHASLYKYQYSVAGGFLYNEELLISYDHQSEHTGGRVAFLQDGKLLLTTADYDQSGPAQLMGRILRINTDGSIPSDNPDPNSYEWTRGHRNPQGLTVGPTGLVYSSEHSQYWDNELNLIVEDQNYGWPFFDNDTCMDLFWWDTCSTPNAENYLPIAGTPFPPSGIDYYDHPAIPEFQNSIIEAGLSGGLIVFNLNATGEEVVQDTNYFGWTEFARIRDVCSAPDGSVYFIGRDRYNIQISLDSAVSDARIHRIYNPFYTPTSIADEHFEVQRKLVKVVDLLGREVDPRTNAVRLNIYSDGTVEKRLTIN